jgi:hypothetical protein
MYERKKRLSDCSGVRQEIRGCTTCHRSAEPICCLCSIGIGHTYQAFRRLLRFIMFLYSYPCLHLWMAGGSTAGGCSVTPHNGPPAIGMPYLQNQMSALSTHFPLWPISPAGKNSFLVIQSGPRHSSWFLLEIMTGWRRLRAGAS